MLHERFASILCITEPVDRLIGIAHADDRLWLLRDDGQRHRMGVLWTACIPPTDSRKGWSPNSFERGGTNPCDMAWVGCVARYGCSASAASDGFQPCWMEQSRVLRKLRRSMVAFCCVDMCQALGAELTGVSVHRAGNIGRLPCRSSCRGRHTWRSDVSGVHTCADRLPASRRCSFDTGSGHG